MCDAILALHHFQEKSFHEISKLLPVTADTAEKIWNKAKVPTTHLSASSKMSLKAYHRYDPGGIGGDA